MKKVLLLGPLLAACGALTPQRPDAGSTGGGASSTGGGGVLTGGGAPVGGGEATGGGQATGGGGVQTGGGAGTGGGGPLPYRFGTVNITATGSGGPVVGFAETDAGLYALDSQGTLLRSTGGPFRALFTLPDQFRAFAGAPGGALFAVTTVSLWHCEGDCTDAGAWDEAPVAGTAFALGSLCVIDGSTVLVLGNAGGDNHGISHLWDGQSIGPEQTVSGRELGRCFPSLSGDAFYLPARDAVVRYDVAGGSFTSEAAPTGGWVSGGAVDGHVWVSGYGPSIAEREGAGWTSRLSLTRASAMGAVVGVGPSEAFGFVGTALSAGDQVIYRFDGSSWRALTPDLNVNLYTVASGLVTSSGVIYVGAEDHSLTRVIVRGARQ